VGKEDILALVISDRFARWFVEVWRCFMWSCCSAGTGGDESVGESAVGGG